VRGLPGPRGPEKGRRVMVPHTIPSRSPGRAALAQIDAASDRLRVALGVSDVVCAWCGRKIGLAMTGGRTSHGMCPDCAAGFEREARRG
jgi:hypothetical protein